MRKNDKGYMRQALDLALMAQGKTSPNPLVGAVIVKNNRVLACGYHKAFGADHAEVDALKKLHGKAKGATLYVNLEPCFHVGKTPPCVDALIASGIKRVVIAMKDPNPLTNGKSVRKLRRHKIQVDLGVLEEEALLLNEAFVCYVKNGMPLITGKTAQTLDGKIACRNGASQWITSGESRAFARQLRDSFDAICVGVNTVVKDDPRLTGVKRKDIKKIIVDSGLKTPLKAKVVGKHCIIATTGKASASKRKALEKQGARVIICPARAGRVDLKYLFKAIAKDGVLSVLIEGGSRLLSQALKDRLVAKMHVYIAPKILGDEHALNSVEGFVLRDIKQAVCLPSPSILRIGDDIFMEGYVKV